MALILIALAILSGAPGAAVTSGPARGGQVARPDGEGRAAGEDDIREAVFRYQFDHNGSGLQKSAKVYYLSLGVTETGKRLDVSDELLGRFKEHKPPVRKVSRANAHPFEGVTDKETGEKGIIFEVRAINRLGEDEAQAEGGYYEAGLSASGVVYSLKREAGKWVVKSAQMLWIS